MFWGFNPPKKAFNLKTRVKTGFQVFIYIYINLGDVAIFSLYMWLAVCHSFVEPQNTTHDRAPNLIFLQGVHVVLPLDVGELGVAER